MENLRLLALAVGRRSAGKRLRHGLRVVLAWIAFAAAFSTIAAERHSDPDGCFSCHGLPGLEHIDKDGVLRTATILQSDYYGSLHGSVPCKDCHRKIERYPHKPEEGYVDCSESCHVNEPSKGKAFTHKPVVDEFKKSAHGSGHAPGHTKDFHGGNRLKEEKDEQNPSCRFCHSNTPYIVDANLERFKAEFHHTETECGTCHPGETWRNQFSGHILRRLVGKNFNKMESNAMCVSCHGDYERMAKVKIEDRETKEKKPATYRFIHVTDSYAKTLHGRYVEVKDESGAACLDCHAPDGLRHAILRDEEKLATTHKDHLVDTCAQAGCHGYAASPMNDGFTKTDLHDTDYLRLATLGFAMDPNRLDSNWFRAMWVLGPFIAVFGVLSLIWYFWRGGRGIEIPILGGEAFQRIMISGKAAAREGVLGRFMSGFGGRRGNAAREADVFGDFSALPAPESDAPPSMTVLFASQTGNGEGIAEDLGRMAAAKGYACHVMDMADYDPADLLRERLLFIVCSTHGEGDPPIAAETLHGFLYAPGAPPLDHLKYGVLALGDSSYKHFCKAGKDFDAFLVRLGATRVLERVDADADYEEAAAAWIESVLEVYHATFGEAGIVGPVNPEVLELAKSNQGEFGKHNPYPARVVRNFNLNGVGSEKETRHIEIDLGDSGFSYEPGDVLGVVPKNNPVLVEALLAALGMDGWREVTVGREAMSLREAFHSRLDITALSRVLLEKYAGLADSRVLTELLAETGGAQYDDYVYGRDLLDLVTDFPLKDVAPQTLVAILRRMPARLYSIASSQKAHPGQVHLTLAAVRYEAHGRKREGVCSTFLAERLGADESLGVFLQFNKHFRLPANPDTDIIMVGPGTGIAPFRAFVEEREIQNGKGRNWLFFGDQRQASDFLYADEWKEKLRRGVLSRMDLAFSRDQESKVYVQDRMLENGNELFAWLQQGAHLYVCGDASRMAPDVHEALITVVSKEGRMSREKAEEYLAGLASVGRYQRDVY